MHPAAGADTPTGNRAIRDHIGDVQQPVELPIAHAAATWFMVGLIRVVHAVHHPLFSAVGSDTFVVYEQGPRDESAICSSSRP